MATKSKKDTVANSDHATSAKSAQHKMFVLDTNVLMHDPTSLFRFEEHDVYLPMITLEELDTISSKNRLA